MAVCVVRKSVWVWVGVRGVGCEGVCVSGFRCVEWVQVRERVQVKVFFRLPQQPLPAVSPAGEHSCSPNSSAHCPLLPGFWYLVSGFWYLVQEQANTEKPGLSVDP